ncbi:glutamate [NMDA] receptor subunit 1-like [Centruroides sculpturatus]|uniref:glutamate [NMDA] receptor subunit 1-like n=1 Tax=Centruroides sculpturatus TaxID=218467 RepID=UPI000C6EA9A5|nr:glutamate [NMDA] receptor subunit 1-like [Centruroides sculpturatus]
MIPHIQKQVSYVVVKPIDEYAGDLASNGSWFGLLGKIVNQPIDEYAGDLASNGSWFGLLGKIVNQEADFTAIGFAITPLRYQFMRYSSVFGFQSIGFVIKTPTIISDLNSITKPFSLKIWIATSLAILLFGFILHKVMEKDFITEKSEVRWSRYKIYWELFSTLTYQGLDLKVVKRFPSRFMIGIWWLSIIVLASCYGGTLMSYMTYPLTEFYPRNFKELEESVQKNEYTCGTAAGNIIWREMLNSKSENMKILKDHISSSNNFISMPYALNRVQEERFAYILHHYVIKNSIKKEDKHKYMISRDSLFMNLLALPMSKGFPYEKNITTIVTRIFEAGIAQRVFPSEDLELPKSSEFRALTLDNFASALLLLVTGYLLSIVCFVVEIIYAYFTGFMRKCLY